MNDAPDPSRRPHTRGGRIYLGIVALGALGLFLVAVDLWRLGVVLLGLGLLVAALFRGILGEYESGMLRVRSRTFDLIALTVLGVLLIGLAINIPNQPS